jgi:hypothetical protein
MKGEKMTAKPRCSFFNNLIATPSMEFVEEFAKIYGIRLDASNSKWYDLELSALSRRFCFDIIEFDSYLDSIDTDYNASECTYKGKTGYSASKYITEKYGERAEQMIIYLNNSDFAKEFEYTPE